MYVVGGHDLFVFWSGIIIIIVIVIVIIIIVLSAGAASRALPENERER